MLPDKVETGNSKLNNSIVGKRFAQMESLVSDSVRPPFPRILMFELTNACNHACLFCANAQMTRRRHFIDAALFSRLLHEGYDLGARDLALHATGEPTLDQRLPDFVRLAEEIGYTYIYLTTNGSAELEFYHALIRAGIHSLKFSINAAKRDTYRLTHGKDHFNKVMENLRALDRWRKENGYSLRLLASFVYTELTRAELDLARAAVGPLVDDFVIAPTLNQGGQTSLVFQLLKPSDSPAPPALGKAKPCFMLWSRAHISYEGYLTICCADFENNLAICDLNSTTLKDAWHHPLFVDMRRRHLSQQLMGTLCHNCLYQVNLPFDSLSPELSTRPEQTRVIKQLERVNRALKRWPDKVGNESFSV